jgi:hypothetical protein
MSEDQWGFVFRLEQVLRIWDGDVRGFGMN